MGGYWLTHVLMLAQASETPGLDAEPLFVKYGVAIGMLVLALGVIGYLYMRDAKATAARIETAEKAREEAMEVARQALDNKELLIENAKANTEQAKMVSHIFDSLREATQRHLPSEKDDQ